MLLRKMNDRRRSLLSMKSSPLWEENIHERNSVRELVENFKTEGKKIDSLTSKRDAFAKIKCDSIIIELFGRVLDVNNACLSAERRNQNSLHQTR